MDLWVEKSAMDARFGIAAKGLGKLAYGVGYTSFLRVELLKRK
jgi:hypothetical protein